MATDGPPHEDSTMTLYRDMTSPELVRFALYGFRSKHQAENRTIYALAKRLEQEYTRANRHHDKLTEVSKDYLNKSRRIEVLENRLASHIKVAKPHIQRVFTMPGGRGMWRCTGPFGTVQYGETPRMAYAAWRQVMGRDHGTQRQLKAAMTGGPDRANDRYRK